MPSEIRLASGATETDIAQALAQLTDGGTIILPPGETIPITSGLIVDVARRDITLDLNGSTLQQAANVTVVTGRGQHSSLEPVSLGQDASGNTTITYANLPPEVEVGGWVKVVADDRLPGEHLDANNRPTRLGEAMQVLSISGTTVTFDGALRDQDLYATNVRATAFVSGDLVIRNGEIVGDPGSGRSVPLLQVRIAVEPRIEDITIRDASAIGFSIVDSVNARIEDPIVKNLQDAGNLGIAVQSLSAKGTTVDGLYAENVTHAADASAIGNEPNSLDPRYYGADIGLEVRDSVAYAARNFAWTWHSEGNESLYQNVMAFDSYGFINARGIGNTISESAGANNERGIILYEYGNADARNITIDDVTLKETLHYATIAINEPRDNRVVDSFFEAYGSSIPLDARFATTLDVTYVRADAQENDVFTGTAADDRLLGGKGDDTLSGADGDDVLWGGAGIDVLTGGSGRDRFMFHKPADAVDVITDFESGPGGDVIDLSVLAAGLGWPRDDLMASGHVRFVQNGEDVELQIDTDGNGDSFARLALLQNVNIANLGPANLIARMSQQSGALAVTTIAGTGGDDMLVGGIGDELLLGFAGNDTLDGGPGNDRLEGGIGDDTYLADVGDTIVEAPDAGSDTVVTPVQLPDQLAAHVEHLTFAGNLPLAGTGNERDNVITGNGAGNALSGLAGDDMLVGAEGNDALDGGDDADVLLAGPGLDTLRGGAGDDQLDGGADADQLYGGTGSDLLRGGDGTDRLLGEDGDDTLEGGPGADTLSGGLGSDTASYAGAATGVTADLAAPATNTGEAAGDFYSAVENLAGSSASDVLRGNAVGNVIDGGSGDDQLFGLDRSDTLRGGEGNDLLDGGAGADVLSGGPGDDTFVFANDLVAGDTITDFTAGGSEDVVRISGFGAALDSFAELSARFVQKGPDVVVQLDTNDSATLRNVAVAALTTEDFWFT